jgi:hypothetical protein
MAFPVEAVTCAKPNPGLLPSNGVPRPLAMPRPQFMKSPGKQPNPRASFLDLRSETDRRAAYEDLSS